jgi:hypothetical protein
LIDGIAFRYVYTHRKGIYNFGARPGAKYAISSVLFIGLTPSRLFAALATNFSIAETAEFVKRESSRTLVGGGAAPRGARCGARCGPSARRVAPPDGKIFCFTCKKGCGVVEYY